MDKIDLDELERLHKAATPGPWRHRTISKTATVILAADTPLCATKYSVNKDHDAAYIVAACNSLPELIAENRELRERVRELEELCGNLNRELVNLMGSFPVTDCRICDYSYWCTRERIQIAPDFDMCKAAILEFCKPDSEEAGE